MANTYTLISSYNLSSDITSGGVTFSAIPSTYSHLYLMYSVRVGRTASSVDDLRITINGNTSSATYQNIRMYGYNSGTGNDGGSGSWSAGYSYLGYGTGPDAVTSNFGSGHFIIPMYQQATTKTMISLASAQTNTAGQYQIGNGALTTSDTNPITSITVIGYNTPQTMFANSTLYLYGLKNS